MNEQLNAALSDALNNHVGTGSSSAGLSVAQMNANLARVGGPQIPPRGMPLVAARGMYEGLMAAAGARNDMAPEAPTPPRLSGSGVIGGPSQAGWEGTAGAGLSAAQTSANLAKPGDAWVIGGPSQADIMARAGQKADMTEATYNPFDAGNMVAGSVNRAVSGITLNEINDYFRSVGAPTLPPDTSLTVAQPMYEALKGRDLELSEKPIKIDPDNPEDTLAGIIRLEDARKREFFDPVEEELAKSANQRNILAQARSLTEHGFQGTAARNERERQRYGLGHNAVAAKQEQQGNALARGAATSNVMNNARVAEYDRSNMINTQLANNSRALMGFSVDGLSNGANFQNGRDSAVSTLLAKGAINRIGQNADRYTTNMGMISGGIGTIGALSSSYMINNYSDGVKIT